MYEFDDSRRPLVIARFCGPTSTSEIQRFMADLDALIDRPESHALIYDLAEAEIPGRELIMPLVPWTRELRVRYRDNFENRIDPVPTFTGYVMSSRLAALLRFFEGMVPRVRHQHHVFASLDEAVTAGEAALELFGRPAPPRKASTGTDG